MEKAVASLTASLLARKGMAQPAMRRQPVAGLAGTIGPRAVTSFDDLGWNDMGDEAETPAPIAQPSPVAKHIAAIQETLSRREEERAQPKLTPVASRKAKARATVPAKAKAPATAARKSAFTLRIDAERHLRLRLLSAVTNQSAQQLLIGALDALIARNPNIDALAVDPKVRPGTSD